MVKKTFFIALSTLFLSLTSNAVLIAAEFIASVSDKEVHLSKSFSLNLTLKDTAPKEAPTITALKDHFLIHSQQQSSSTTIINGKVSSSITWKISLIPKVEGIIQIPPINIETEEGVLSTEAITLNVRKASNSQSNEDSAGMDIITKMSNTSPYKNEPAIYTASLTSKTPLYNVQTQKLQIENAIVEFLGEPKLEEKIIEGVLLNIVEINYLITPLKPGPLIIPPIAIQGAIPEKRKGQGRSFFNDNLDPFGIMQGDRLKPFALMTEEITLDIQPAVSEVSPWLPAKTLTIEELFPNDQTLRVGEPFSRGFLITAEGVKTSQLPHLEDLQGENSTFKVYTDKPEERETVSEDIIHSMRKEQYTLIPQQTGTWILPEISISWWDSIKKEKKIATVPARTVYVLPALINEPPISNEISSNPIETPISSAPTPYVLYTIIAILTCLLIAALLWGLILQRKTTSLTKDPSQKMVKPQADKPKKSVPSPVKVVQTEKKEKLPDLNPT